MTESGTHQQVQRTQGARRAQHLSTIGIRQTDHQTGGMDTPDLEGKEDWQSTLWVLVNARGQWGLSWASVAQI